MPRRARRRYVNLSALAAPRARRVVPHLESPKNDTTPMLRIRGAALCLTLSNRGDTSSCAIFPRRPSSVGGSRSAERIMSGNLTQEKALIFRIAHRDNVPWIIANGLRCRNSDIADPNFVTIGNPDLINTRHTRRVSCEPFGTLSDYVPFYFTPFTPMLLNITTGFNGIRQRPRD
jgi:hypothetical protein